MAGRRNPDGWGRKPHKWRGRWRSYLTVGYKASGEADRRYVYGATQAECIDRLDELRRQHALGTVAHSTELTVAAYLEEWLDQKAHEVTDRTVKIYRYELAHVTKRIGRVKLARLTPRHVQRMMREIAGATVTYGKPNNRRTVTLSNRSANEARAVLGNALDDAVTLGLIAANPVTPVKNLRHEEAPLTVWTAEQIMRFTSTTASGGADYHALYYLVLTSGLRAGELIALTWDDLAGDRLHVRRTATLVKTTKAPKSKAGNRTLALPSDTLETLDRHRHATAQAGIESSLLFPTRSGGMLSHSNLRRSLRLWAVKADVPILRVHDLRHTYASMAIAAGMTAPELARQLGHTDASFTLRQYVHFFERATPRVAPSLAELLGLPRKGVQPGGTGTAEAPN